MHSGKTVFRSSLASFPFASNTGCVPPGVETVASEPSVTLNTSAKAYFCTASAGYNASLTCFTSQESYDPGRMPRVCGAYDSSASFVHDIRKLFTRAAVFGRLAPADATK